MTNQNIIVNVQDAQEIQNSREIQNAQGVEDFSNVLNDPSAVPACDLFEKWINAALKDEKKISEMQLAQLESAQQNIEITVRIVGHAESQELNQRYRKKNKPTNVLAFPYGLDDMSLDDPHIGDLVICAPLVKQEALEQEKDVEAHWAHLVIHGCLHLVGYDHIHDEDTVKMEKREVELLADLGYPDPYADPYTGD